MLRQFDPTVPIEQTIKAWIKETMKAPPFWRKPNDSFDRGYIKGYKEGLRRALNIVNTMIGSRMDPPNLWYRG
jgi:hypothetical protein